MFRNQYDNDATTWSPQGRIFQVEYALEAVKLGSCAVAIKGKDCVVLAALKRRTSELGSYQQKVFAIDDHIGVSISGLCADARLLCNFMRTECMNHQYVYQTGKPVDRLVNLVADKAQKKTRKAGGRPYGVGFIVIGYDSQPRLYEVDPSGNAISCHAAAMGARSQSSKTYLEKKLETFSTLEKDSLIDEALKALRESLQTLNNAFSSEESVGTTATTLPNIELNNNNCTIAYVSKDEKLTIIEDENMQPFITRMLSQTQTQTQSQDTEMN